MGKTLKICTLAGNFYIEIFLKGRLFSLYVTNVIFSRACQYASLNHSQVQGRIATTSLGDFAAQYSPAGFLWPLPAMITSWGRLVGPLAA